MVNASFKIYTGSVVRSGKCTYSLLHVTPTQGLFLPGDLTVLHRGTPLYGQPAWWGDGDTGNQQHGRTEEKSSDKKREKAETGTILKYIYFCFSDINDFKYVVLIHILLLPLY